jgi:CshA-type fibril repeat protein
MHLSTRLVGRVRVVAAVVLATLLVASALTVATATPASAAGTGTWQIEQFVRWNNTNGTTFAVPSGDTFRYIVNYTCADDSCPGGTLTIPLPSGYHVGAPTYNVAHLTNLVRTDNNLVFTIAPNIDAGTTGQIDVQAWTDPYVTPNGTNFSEAATISTGGAPDVVSATTSVTIQAASLTTVTITKEAGGATDDIAKYGITTCNGPTGAPATGGLAVQASSTLSVQLPAGAVVEDADGGTVTGSPPAISWTQPYYSQFQCLGHPIVVSYPATDETNVDGATKQLDATWTRALVGESAAATTGAYSSDLVTKTALIATGYAQYAPYSYAPDLPYEKVDYGTAASYVAGLSNYGTGTLDDTDVQIAVDPKMNVVSVSALNPGHGVATVYLTTTCGPDREPGTGDDGDEEPFATIAASGTLATASTTAAWPSGATAIDGPCWVTNVRIRITKLWPGDGSNFLTVNAGPTNPDRAGNPTAYGDVVSMDMTAAGTNSAGTSTSAGTKTTMIQGAPPPPPPDPNTYVTVRAGGPGAFAAGVTQATGWVTGYVYNRPLTDPVLTIALPPNISLVSTVPNNFGNGLPAPTITQTADFDGNGGTLVQFSFPPGSEIPAGSAYGVDYTVERNELAYGDVGVPFYTGSSTSPFVCTENWFGNSADYGCRWDGSVSITPSASATVTTKIKGSFDSGFVAGPATGQTAPGSPDAYQVVLKNTGTTELDQLVMVDKLPRPGDTKTTSAVQRNQSTRTFPVVLRGAPTTPTLPTAATISWSTVTGACQPELGYNPGGCQAPQWHDWATDPPADVTDVLMVKVDFGANVLKPGRSWTIDLPVTTPTTGATEPDRADFNPDPLHVPNETAVNTIAFKGVRKDISTALATTEPPGVTLEVPGALGPVGPAPTASPITTHGTGTAVHTATVTPPTSGAVKLLDGTAPVDTLVVPGVGTYSVVPATGIMTFTPELGFSGTAPDVGYRILDAYGQSDDSTWTAIVDPPAAPSAPALTSTGPVRTVQTVTVTVPAGGSAHLLDGSTPVTALTVPLVGTYTIVPATGVVTFTPLANYHGTPAAVPYRVTDAYSQTADGTYTPTVTLASLTASPVTTTGVGTATHTTTIAVPPFGAVHFLQSGSPVDSITIPGQGTYTIDPGTGAVTFAPVLGFSGTGTSIAYVRSDDFGQTASSTYTATVTKPAPPTAPTLTSSSTLGAPLAPQSVTVVIPADTEATLLDAHGNPTTTVTVAGQGTFVLDPVTGVIVFTPVDGWTGPSSVVPLRLTDAYGQSATGSYTASLPQRPVTRLPVETGVAGPRPSITVPVPPGGSITLVAPGGTTGNRVTIPGQGTYILDPTTGTITFEPDEGFTGSPIPVTYRITAADGSVSEGTFAPTVTAADPAGSGSPTGSVAYTGAGSSRPLVFLGATLLAIGGFLMLARRRGGHLA